MADEADKADEMIERQMAAAIKAIQGNTRMRPIGLCYFCQSEVEGDARFCDKDCLADWQKEQDCKARNGD
jgi:hypothetical protein